MAYVPEVSGFIGIGDSPSSDAFSRLRVAEPTNLFTVQNLYETEILKLEAGATGAQGVAPAHSANTRMVALSVTAGSGTSFVQSYQYFPYEPGRSHLVFLTGVIGAAVTGSKTEIGYFDDNNGIFFRQASDGTLSWVRRTSTSGSMVEEVVAQDAWNLDRLTGADASDVTLDITDAQIFLLDLQFLAMGRVRVGFDIGGQIIYCHEFNHANVITVPYMQTASLPVRMEVTASGTAGTKTAYFKCASVISEGGFDEGLGFDFATPEATVTAGSGAQTALLSIRPRTSFNSIANRITLIPTSVNMLVTGNFPIFWELCVGASFSAAPTYANVDATYSSVEYTTAPGTLSAAGIRIASGYLAASGTVKGSTGSRIHQPYPLTLNRAGSQRALGTLTLIVTGIGGASATRASIEYTEVR